MCSSSISLRPMSQGMKAVLLPIFALFCFSSCGARITVLPATLEAARAAQQEAQQEVTAEELPAEDASVPLKKVTPPPEESVIEPEVVTDESPSEIPPDAPVLTAVGVELLSVNYDSERERVSVVIDAPTGSEVTYRLDGEDPVAAEASFDIDDVSAREHILDVIVYVPGGASKEFKLAWDENHLVPSVSEAFWKGKKKHWKRIKPKNSRASK